MLANERIGRYELVAHLAAGGMGQVYLARTAGLGGFERHVVIKTLDTEALDSDEHDAAAMFLDEARVLGLLHHQHIAPVYEIDRDKHRLYLVMDYVHGHTAHDVWARTVEIGAALPIDFTLTVVAAAASGLHYAHTRRGPDGKRLHIVHRDVTLSNLMVGFDGAIKLIDFGIAKAANRSTKTQVGFVKGKVGYMAPEQIRGQAVDARTDVFALGIVLYELSTMRRAFREESDLATLERIRNGQIVLPTTFIPDYPRELERIVARALRTDPRERYPDADSMRRELEALGHGLGLVLGDAAIVEVMSQLFENVREPWQQKPRAGRAETELDVALEIVPAPFHEDDQVTRLAPSRALRSSTQAADDLLKEPPQPNGKRRRAVDTDAVTVLGTDIDLGKETNPIEPIEPIDSERVTVPGAMIDGMLQPLANEAPEPPPPPAPLISLPPLGPREADPPSRGPAIDRSSSGLSSAGGGVTIKGGARKDFDEQMPPLPLPPPPPNPSARMKKAPKPIKTQLVLPAQKRPQRRAWVFAAVVTVAAIGAAVFVVHESGGDGAAQASDGARPGAVPKTAEAPPIVLSPSIVDEGSGSAARSVPIVPPPPTSVTLKITTTPSDATLLLDGKRLGKTPFEGSVEASPGMHVIKIRRRGYATTRLDVELMADVARDVELIRSRGEPAP